MGKRFAVRLRSERRGRSRRHGKERPRRSSVVGAACHHFYDRPIWVEVREELRQAWVDWIRVNDPFDWFVTFTFKEDVSVEHAQRLLDRWLARLAQACRDKSGHAAPLTCVCAIEWTTNLRVHLHLVVKAPKLRDHRRVRCILVNTAGVVWHSSKRTYRGLDHETNVLKLEDRRENPVDDWHPLDQVFTVYFGADKVWHVKIRS